MNKEKLEKIIAAIEAGKIKDVTTLAVFEIVEEMREDLDETIKKVEDRLPDIKSMLEQVKGKDGENGEKGADGRDGRDGEDADELAIEQRITAKLPDEKKIISVLEKKLPSKESVVKRCMAMLPTKEEIAKKVIVPEPEKIDEQKIVDKVEADLPSLGDKIRDGLELLSGESRLRIEAINGLEEILEELKKQKLGGGRVGGGFNYMAMDIHIVDDQTPTGTIDGVNTTFTIGNAPNPIASLKVYINGMRMNLTEDYTFSANTITFLVAPVAGDKIKVDYRI